MGHRVLKVRGMVIMSRGGGNWGLRNGSKENAD